MTKDEFVKGLQVKADRLRHATVYKIELTRGVEITVDEVEAAQHADFLKRALGVASEQLWQDIHSEFLNRDLLAKVSKLRRLLERFEPLFMAEENRLIEEIFGCLSTPPNAGERLAAEVQTRNERRAFQKWAIANPEFTDGLPICCECNTRMEFDEVRDHETGELRQPPFYHCPGCGHNIPV